MYLGTFTGNSEAHVNWKSMRDTPNAFFSKESVPKDFTWVDPSHMQKDQMTQLLDHWLGRQEEGHVGLQFTGCPRTNYRRNDYRRKTKDNQDDEGENLGKREGKKGQSTPPRPDPVDPVDPVDPIDPIDPIDLVDPNAPFSMLNKSSEEKIVYLRTLCMDKNYQNMIEVLVNSDKVSVFFKTSNVC